MKNLKIIASIFIVLYSHTIFSQNEFTEKVIQIGPSYGVPFFADYQTDEIKQEKVDASIGFNVFGEFAIFRRLSFGVGYHRSIHKDDITRIVYTSPTFYTIEPGKMKITSSTAVIRTLWHFHNFYKKQNEKIDLYAGLGTAYIDYRYQLLPENGPPENVRKDLGKIQAHAIVGGRFYFTEHIGGYAEVSLFNNYFVSVGVAYRFRWKVLEF